MYPIIKPVVVAAFLYMVFVMVLEFGGVRRNDNHFINSKMECLKNKNCSQEVRLK